MIVIIELFKEPSDISRARVAMVETESLREMLDLTSVGGLSERLLRQVRSLKSSCFSLDSACLWAVLGVRYGNFQ